MVKDIKEIFSENLKRYMDIKGENITKLSDSINVAYSTVSDWIHGRKMPRSGSLELLAEHYDINISDLTSAKFEMIPSQRPSKRIPIIGEIACGDPITAEENIEGYLYEPIDSLPSGNLFYLKAKGHSMEPTIPDGSNVLIREQPEVEDDEIAAVLVNGDTEATLKRIKHQGDIVMLMPDNASYSPYIVTRNNPARILGKAIRFTTDL
ncbi:MULTISPECIES: LexA family protein [Companilactobacillus]|uniref:Repressor LexA n=3 Tax=Companilactobacillus TaxID=2767879 RepID=A0A202F7R0_9LACO|nr:MULTISPECIES: XRE family transcriptional regulator [Companilactobacillus]KRK83435.1 peptidase s24-like protein [Companilactobacillus bobalius DSM 19674]OVE96511.1 Repressor LexA [Companilactobacillus bobalius]GEO58514.1 hypothetical protein LBO01_16430 [Companilactobacillus paralimentarius]